MHSSEALGGNIYKLVPQWSSGAIRCCQTWRVVRTPPCLQEPPKGRSCLRSGSPTGTWNWGPHSDMELGTPQGHGAGDPAGTRNWGSHHRDMELGTSQGHGAGDPTGTWNWGPHGTRSWGPHRDMELPAFQHRPDTLSAATAGSSELWPGSLCWEHLRRSLLVFQSTNPWQLHFPV